MELIYEKVVAIVASAQTDYLDMIQQDKEGQVPFLYNQRELVRRINHYIMIDTFKEIMTQSFGT